MKTKNNYFRVGILLLGIFLIVVNCQKDDIVKTIEQESPSFTIKKITFDDFSSKTINSRALEFIKPRLNIEKKETQRNIDALDGTFSIRTEDILLLETDSTSTYTFQVKNMLNDSHSFEKFIIKLNNENEPTYRVLGFTKIENSTEVELPYLMESMEIDNSLIDLNEFYEITQAQKMYYWDGICLWSEVSAGCDCYVLVGCVQEGEEGTGTTGWYDLNTSSNYDDSSGTTTVTYEGFGPHGDFTVSWEVGGGGSSSSSGTTIIPDPIAISIPYDQQIRNCLGIPDTTNGFNYSDWLATADYFEIKAVATFLSSASGSGGLADGETNCSNPQAQEFTNLAIQAFMNQNITIEQFLQFHNYISTSENTDATINESISILNILNTNETDEVKQQQLLEYLEANTPLVSNSQLPDYKTEILRMTSWMRLWGNPDYVPFADYIDSIVNDSNFYSFPLGDVIDIYHITRNRYVYIKGMYFFAFVVPMAEAAYPFIVYAVIDATIGVAIPLLSRIPLAWVIRGTKLEAMILKTTELGVQGNNAFVRIINNQVSASKAETLFSTLTKDAIQVYPPINTPLGQLIKADMGNGNWIVLRYFSSSNPTAHAVVEYNYTELLGTNSFELKFLP